MDFFHLSPPFLSSDLDISCYWLLLSYSLYPILMALQPGWMCEPATIRYCGCRRVDHSNPFRLYFEVGINSSTRVPTTPEAKKIVPRAINANLPG